MIVSSLARSWSTSSAEGCQQQSTKRSRTHRNSRMSRSPTRPCNERVWPPRTAGRADRWAGDPLACVDGAVLATLAGTRLLRTCRRFLVTSCSAAGRVSFGHQGRHSLLSRSQTGPSDKGDSRLSMMDAVHRLECGRSEESHNFRYVPIPLSKSSKIFWARDVTGTFTGGACQKEAHEPSTRWQPERADY